MLEVTSPTICQIPDLEVPRDLMNRCLTTLTLSEYHLRGQCFGNCCRIMRNLSLPVVWEDVQRPEEWERDASSIPDKYSKGRYVFWAWTHATTEQAVLPFQRNTSASPILLDLSQLVINNTQGFWNSSIKPPGSMGVLFRDPSTYNLTLQGNNPLQRHMVEAGIQPTNKWPAVLYGTLPAAWAFKQADSNDITFPNLEVV